MAPGIVVGLVEDTMYRSPQDEMEPVVYVPLAQSLTGDVEWPFATLGVRSASRMPVLSGIDSAISGAFTPESHRTESFLG